MSIQISKKNLKNSTKNKLESLFIIHLIHIFKENEFTILRKLKFNATL